MDHPAKTYSGGSEDLLVYKKDALSAEERAELEKLRDDLDILKDNVQVNYSSDDEFPPRPSLEIKQCDLKSDARNRKDDAEKPKKRRELMVKRSRRKT